MSEAETREPLRGRIVPFPGGAPGPQAGPAAPPQQVTFSRDELRTILNLYGRRVAEGEWRDYAIDFARDRAVFAIYRRSSELPLYRIVKDPKLARRQGAFSVETTSGLVLKRGHELAHVLRVLDKSLKLVSG
ncbi:DUF2794 domain-containing protein [Enterovirga sp.]|jgi:hypothetical protein|uniref:DUF2794 domain-containing protein n=1 Tax=Enterovirga sp. TaxID=2026350 RepID=UPI002619712B|nr:DUF2794 domain-containing protein [Enterovirga sp.]MDB5573895.1 hypothetical protein [Tardiphaga sp.]MDB5591808.1 hypothetical protein [Enterovirga sp.]